MSAALLGTKFIRQIGSLWTYSRITCYRFHQKRCLQEAVSIPEPAFEQDKQGNLVAPVARAFPRGLDIDPEVLSQYQEDPTRYSKTHAGLMHPDKVPYLPEHLVKNARAVLVENDLISHSKFKDDVKHLQEVYWRRQPPISESFKQEKIQELKEKHLAEEIERENINFEELHEGIKERLLHRVGSVSNKVFKKTSHMWKPIDYRDHTGLVYLAARLAPNYTVLYRIFYEIHKLDSSFNPGAVLNVGSGTGSAVWAANEIWARKVYEYYNVDISNYMNDLARKLLAKDIVNPLDLVIPGVHFRQSLPSPQHIENRFPLVVSAYLLMEQPSMIERLNLVTLLWELTEDYLVFVEHGTTAGYRLILEARELIFKLRDRYPDLDGHVFSPCTHDMVCPKLYLKNSPCTFPLEYRIFNIGKEYGQGYTKATERYSYVVLKKGKKQEGKRYPRLTNVLHKSAHSPCTMCCPDGTLRQFVVTRKRPSVALHKCTKRCSPGDFIPFSWPDTSTQISDNVNNESRKQKNNDKNLKNVENDINIEENLK
ncbi:methyltransferase-like protein 17, mitochondrial [Mercenaria mercenaria]|uniref:methyltransferase-like protein 17, mitochondrial n=1 Tax=Mercenaria mercenaria TaxID=6596 RepID=UPI00234EE740|nr:methyltransferase-like protein 17, mitochondrial [Mercenaria mercenaria]